MAERLGDRLKRARLKRQLGLRETASRLGISAAYLSRIENGQEAYPPAEKLIGQLATLLGENVDDLMQLAGRVAEDVEQVIKDDPSMPAFLRVAREKKVSGTELLEMLQRRKGGK